MDLKSVSKAWSSETLVRGQAFMESQGQPTHGPPHVKAGFVSEKKHYIEHEVMGM